MVGMRYNFHTALAPLRKMMRARREDLGLSAAEAARQGSGAPAWISELENRTVNPSLNRLATWAEAMKAQEFGLYIVIDGNYTTVPVFDDGDPDNDPANPTAAETDPASDSAPADPRP